MKTEPLYWPVDWKKLSFINRMFMWNPLFGKAISIHTDLCKQLKSRDKDDLSLWAEFSDEIQKAANKVTEIAVTHLGWPKDSIFIPNDPSDIILWDATGDLDGVEAVVSIEKELGITMPDDFWVDVSGKSFLELLEILNQKKQNQQVDPTVKTPVESGNEQGTAGHP